MSQGQQCNMRLQPTEYARFKRVAKRLGLNISDTIRFLMKLADDAQELDTCAGCCAFKTCRRAK